MIRSLEEAQAQLSRYAPLIREAIAKALREFMNQHGGLRHRYTARTEASIIHDYMVAHIQQDLDGIPGINFRRKRNLFLIGIDGKWTIRLKKLDKRLRSSNIPTQQVLDFLAQVQMRLPGVEEPTNVQIGYQRQGPEVTTSSIWMTCPDGSRVAWTWCLDAIADLGAAPTATPLTPVQPVQPAAARVRPRAIPDRGEAETPEASTNDRSG